jgi:S-adenosylmethionine:tRNA ribosyltransferase-isomerase
MNNYQTHQNHFNINEPLSLNTFNYSLPDDKIAQFPLEERDKSKLLFYKNGQLEDRVFSELPDLLPKGSSLLFNNSKVIPARLLFHKESGVVIEVFLLEPAFTDYVQTFASTTEVIFKTLIGNKKRWRLGQTLESENRLLRIEWEDREANLVKILWDTGQTFAEIISKTGQIPLPPYLNRNPVDKDISSYQTIYAMNPGAVAAPTAGLHFTENVMKELNKAEISQHHMTLHVSAGTFLPVKTENVLEHEMHREVFYFDKADIEFLSKSTNPIPVGTTALRMAESLYWIGVRLLEGEEQPYDLPKHYPYEAKHHYSKAVVWRTLAAVCSDVEFMKASTSLMILPGYEPKVTKGLITNFHQPCSTLIMLVAALLKEDWKKVYNHALSNNYRFLSYGDSSLLLW